MTFDHDRIRKLLDEYIDGELSEREREGVAAHLEECARCAAEVESLLALRAGTAELPREIAPSRDLWPEILARMQAAAPEAPLAPARAAGEGEGIIDLASRRRPAIRWTGGLGRAAAVFLLVAASSGVTAYLMRGSNGVAPVAVAPVEEAPTGARTGTRTGEVLPPAASPAVSESPDRSGGAPARPSSAGGNVSLASSRTDPKGIEAFRTGAGGYDGAVEQLSAAFESQRDRLNPETVKVIEQNLAIIDRAIAESRAALAKDPNNPELPLLLSGVYRQKVELLESAVQLQART